MDADLQTALNAFLDALADATEPDRAEAVEAVLATVRRPEPIRGSRAAILHALGKSRHYGSHLRRLEQAGEIQLRRIPDALGHARWECVIADPARHRAALARHKRHQLACS